MEIIISLFDSHRVILFCDLKSPLNMEGKIPKRIKDIHILKDVHSDEGVGEGIP